MKKLLNNAFIYAILAICGGVFYREYTKLMNFNGRTMLAFVHTHLFVLGMFMFLILVLFALNTNLEKNKNFKKFIIIYNVGLMGTVIMMIVRGIIQVNGTILTKGLSSMISGVAGLFHITLTVALIMLFMILKKCLIKKEN
jgi:hypothetical protein